MIELENLIDTLKMMWSMDQKDNVRIEYCIKFARTISKEISGLKADNAEYEDEINELLAENTALRDKLRKEVAQIDN